MPRAPKPLKEPNYLKSKEIDKAKVPRFHHSEIKHTAVEKFLDAVYKYIEGDPAKGLGQTYFYHRAHPGEPARNVLLRVLRELSAREIQAFILDAGIDTRADPRAGSEILDFLNNLRSGHDPKLDDNVSTTGTSTPLRTAHPTPRATPTAPVPPAVVTPPAPLPPAPPQPPATRSRVVTPPAPVPTLPPAPPAPSRVTHSTPPHGVPVAPPAKPPHQTQVLVSPPPIPKKAAPTPRHPTPRATPTAPVPPAVVTPPAPLPPAPPQPLRTVTPHEIPAAKVRVEPEKDPELDSELDRLLETLDVNESKKDDYFEKQTGELATLEGTLVGAFNDPHERTKIGREMFEIVAELCIKYPKLVVEAEPILKSKISRSLEYGDIEELEHLLEEIANKRKVDPSDTKLETLERIIITELEIKELHTSNSSGTTIPPLPPKPSSLSVPLKPSVTSSKVTSTLQPTVVTPPHGVPVAKTRVDPQSADNKPITARAGPRLTSASATTTELEKFDASKTRVANTGKQPSLLEQVGNAWERFWWQSDEGFDNSKPHATSPKLKLNLVKNLPKKTPKRGVIGKVIDTLTFKGPRTRRSARIKQKLADFETLNKKIGTHNSAKFTDDAKRLESMREIEQLYSSFLDLRPDGTVDTRFFYNSPESYSGYISWATEINPEKAIRFGRDVLGLDSKLGKRFGGSYLVSDFDKATIYECLGAAELRRTNGSKQQALAYFEKAIELGSTIRTFRKKYDELKTEGVVPTEEKPTFMDRAKAKIGKEVNRVGAESNVIKKITELKETSKLAENIEEEHNQLETEYDKPETTDERKLEIAQKLEDLFAQAMNLKTDGTPVSDAIGRYNLDAETQHAYLIWASRAGKHEKVIAFCKELLGFNSRLGERLGGQVLIGKGNLRSILHEYLGASKFALAKGDVEKEQNALFLLREAKRFLPGNANLTAHNNLLQELEKKYPQKPVTRKERKMYERTIEQLLSEHKSAREREDYQKRAEVAQRILDLINQIESKHTAKVPLDLKLLALMDLSKFEEAVEVAQRILENPKPNLSIIDEDVVREMLTDAEEKLKEKAIYSEQDILKDLEKSSFTSDEKEQYKQSRNIARTNLVEATRLLDELYAKYPTENLITMTYALEIYDHAIHRKDLSPDMRLGLLNEAKDYFESVELDPNYEDAANKGLQKVKDAISEIEKETSDSAEASKPPIEPTEPIAPTTTEEVPEPKKKGFFRRLYEESRINKLLNDAGYLAESGTLEGLKKGISKLEEVLGMDPNNFQAGYNLSAYYMTLGNADLPNAMEHYAKAKLILQRFTKLYPDDYDLKSMLEQISQKEDAERRLSAKDGSPTKILDLQRISNQIMHIGELEYIPDLLLDLLSKLHTKYGYDPEIEKMLKETTVLLSGPYTIREYNIADLAVVYGNLEIIKFLHENYPSLLDRKILANIINKNGLPILRFLMENGYRNYLAHIVVPQTKLSLGQDLIDVANREKLPEIANYLESLKPFEENPGEERKSEKEASVVKDAEGQKKPSELIPKKVADLDKIISSLLANPPMALPQTLWEVEQAVKTLEDIDWIERPDLTSDLTSAKVIEDMNRVLNNPKENNPAVVSAAQELQKFLTEEKSSVVSASVPTDAKSFSLRTVEDINNAPIDELLSQAIPSLKDLEGNNLGIAQLKLIADRLMLESKTPENVERYIPKAKEILRRLIEAEPNNPELYRQLGQCLKLSKDYDLAIIHYIKAIDLEPNNYYLHTQLAEIYEDKNMLNLALDTISEAIKLAPKDELAYYQQSRVYEKLGRIPEAIASVKKAIEVGSKDALAYSKLGRLYRISGNIPEAIANYELALTQAPGEDLRKTIEDILKTLKENPQKRSPLPPPYLTVELWNKPESIQRLTKLKTLLLETKEPVDPAEKILWQKLRKVQSEEYLTTADMFEHFLFDNINPSQQLKDTSTRTLAFELLEYVIYGKTGLETRGKPPAPPSWGKQPVTPKFPGVAKSSARTTSGAPILSDSLKVDLAEKLGVNVSRRMTIYGDYRTGNYLKVVEASEPIITEAITSGKPVPLDIIGRLAVSYSKVSRPVDAKTFARFLLEKARSLPAIDVVNKHTLPTIIRDIITANIFKEEEVNKILGVDDWEELLRQFYKNI